MEKENIIAKIKNYLIKLDAHQYIVCKKVIVNGRIYERKHTYHPSLQDCIKEVFLREEHKKLSNCKELEECIKVIKENREKTEEYINKLLK
jgi:hypothetical protein